MSASSDHAYRGLVVASWDLFRPNAERWADVAFYRDVVRTAGQPALDVGCATGRLVLTYLAEGMDVDGVDASPEMLAVCREKAAKRGLAPKLYQQSMETLDLPRRYSTIIVSSSTFQLVTDPKAAAQALRHFHAHLVPGGTLVMSLMLPYSGADPGAIVRTEWGQPSEAVRPEDGATIRRWSRSTYDLAAQLEHTEDRYEVELNGRIVAREEHARSPAVRWYTQAESVALLMDAGFEDVRLSSGFTHEPARPGDALWCVIANRRAAP